MGWKKANFPQRESGALSVKITSLKLGDPFPMPSSGFMLSLLSLAGRDQQSFTSHRWEAGSGHGQHRHYIRRTGKGTGRHTAGSLAIQTTSFQQRFLSVITTGARVFSLCKAAAGHLGNLTVGERGSRKVLTANQDGFSLLHSQTRREGLEGFPGWMDRNQSFAFPCPPLGFPRSGDAKGSSGTLMLKGCLLPIWCDAKAFQQSTSERIYSNLTACISAKYKWIVMGRSGGEKALSTPSTCLQLKISKAWHNQCC